MQYDAGDNGTHSIPRVYKEQESKTPMVRFIESYFCWHRVKTSVALLLHCRDWLKAKTRSKERPPSVIADRLDPLELQAAETAIIKCVRHQYFKGEMEVLKARKLVVIRARFRMKKGYSE